MGAYTPLPLNDEALNRAMMIARQNIAAAGAPPPTTGPLAQQPEQPSQRLQPQPATPRITSQNFTPVPQSFPQASSTASPPTTGVPAPAPSQSQQELDSLIRSKSGVERLPGAARVPLQILSAVGGAFAPRLTSLIPGTPLNHQMKIREAEANVNQEQKTATAEANRQHQEAVTKGLPAEDALREAQTEEARARAESLRNPPEKEEAEGRTITTEQGIMGWNPQTKRYDIPMGKAPAKESATVEHYQDAEGNLWALHPGGEATPITAGGKQLKGKVEQKVESTEQQYIDEYRAKHKGATVEDAYKAFKSIEPPQKPPQGMVVTPQGEIIEARPGVHLPEGSQTLAGVNAVNTPTMTQRTAAGRAATVVEMAPEVMARIDSLSSKLGPIAGKWNEFMQGKIGLNDPDFAALRSDLLMMSSAVALAHAQGRLPENLREEFDNAINAPKQTPANLKATIQTMLPWLKAMQGQGKAAGAAPNSEDYATFNGKSMHYKGPGPRTDPKNWEEVKK